MRIPSAEIDTEAAYIFSRAKLGSLAHEARISLHGCFGGHETVKGSTSH